MNDNNTELLSVDKYKMSEIQCKAMEELMIALEELDTFIELESSSVYEDLFDILMSRCPPCSRCNS